MMRQTIHITGGAVPSGRDIVREPETSLADELRKTVGHLRQNGI